MAGGSKGRRTYARDNRGRFASTGTARSRPAPKQAATKGTNRLTRNNSGRIVGIGRSGATARGGRLRTGAGNQRATQTARLKTAKPAGTIKTKSLSPEANFRIIRQQKGRFPKVGAAAQAMQKRGALKNSGDIEQLAAIAKRAMAGARKQQTSKPVKAAKPAQRQSKPPKRLSYKIQYHGTNKQAAKAIRMDGFKESRSGVYGSGVYSSSHRSTARQYSPKKDGTILRLRVPKAQFDKAAVISGNAPMEVRARNRAQGITKVQDHLDYRPQERWLVSPAQDATKWLDHRQVIPVRRGIRKPAAKPKATPKPKASRSPATSRLRPGELMNAVARPVGTMARPRKGENPFGTKDKTKKQNLSIALSWLNSKGFKGQLYSEGAKLRGQAIARFIPSTPVVRYNKDGSQSRVITQGELQLNQSNNYWRNPRSSNTRNRATGFLSTSSPVGTLYHEIGHSRDKRLSLPGYVRNWGTAYSGTKQETKAIARRVSRYATTNPAEFIAETYAGLKTGRRYDFQVMRAYRKAMGLSPNPAARRRSRVRRPKP